MFSTGAHAASLTSNDASNLFVLLDGTELDPADELDMASGAGKWVCVACYEAEHWYVTSQNGIATDGEAAD